MTTHIKLNGQPYELATNQTIATLIDTLGLAGKRYAVEINDNILPRSQHHTRHLVDGDCVEIVHAIGGG